MLKNDVLAYGRNKSSIRELMAYGEKRKKEIGSDNVFDFSIGNPNIPSPKSVVDAIKELADEDPILVHSYTSANGLLSLRERIAEDLNERFDLNFKADSLYMTCGAAASLTICLNAFVEKEEEVIVFAPYFAEYKVFIEARGAKCIEVQPDENYEIDFADLLKKINEKTIGLIVNTPNNPSGVIYSKETLTKLADILREKEEEYHKTIYLISDEPYRELVYDKKFETPLKYYDDSLMCYSFSKSLSLPGERIGYIAVNPKINNEKDVYSAINGSGRSLGFVNAPSMFQRVIEKCYKDVTDVSIYKRNRDLLMKGLDELGYEFIKPEGAFYLFVKALEDDSKAFSKVAMKHELLLVPSDDFGTKGYVRVAYCVSEKTILNSFGAFKSLKEEYEVMKNG